MYAVVELEKSDCAVRKITMTSTIAYARDLALSLFLESCPESVDKEKLREHLNSFNYLQDRDWKFEIVEINS